MEPIPEIEACRSAVPYLAGDQRVVDEILRCFICFDRVKDPHLCPSCGSMCCRDCIVKWLTERKTQCPHCQTELRVAHLVKCRVVQELTMAVDRLQSQLTNASELCSIHRNELQYYCTNCSQCICSDCVIFSTMHSGHVFEKLGAVHEKHAQVIKAEINSIELRLAALRQVETSIDSNIIAVNASKDDAIFVLNNLAQSMEKSIMQQLKDKLLILESRRNDVAKQLSLLESVMHELNCHLDPTICPKSELIQKSSHLSSMARHIHEKPISCLLHRDRVSDEFQSDLVPTFSEQLFEIPAFIEALSTEEVMYSKSLFRNGYTWRLKVYPNGNGTAREVFISVFLELTSGLSGTDQIEYSVHMVNHKDRAKTIVRRFCSNFEVGESWGYNRFFRIDVITRDGYLSDDGSLLLKFLVRPPSMYLANIEQEKYITSLERARHQQGSMIRSLRKRVFLMAAPFPDVDAESGKEKSDRVLESAFREAISDGESDVILVESEMSDMSNNEDEEDLISLQSLMNKEHDELVSYECGESQQVYSPCLDLGKEEEAENLPELDNIRALNIE